MDATQVPKLAQDSLKILRDVSLGLLTVWEKRGLRKPVVQASDLFFRTSGMRQALEQLSSSDGSEADIQILKKHFDASENEVQEIVKELDAGWDKLTKLPDGLEIANEIGKVIHSPIGKMGIRSRIRELIASSPNDPETIRIAGQLCTDIDQFNERLIELHQRILTPAAKFFETRAD